MTEERTISLNLICNLLQGSSLDASVFQLAEVAGRRAMSDLRVFSDRNLFASLI
jgi:hypothetical protein